MKLKPLIEKIGFSKHLSKGVEDVAADKFEDFGVTVGQLYQTFLKKDLTADPAIAQKIMDMVDTDDDAVLANQIKDLEFLINQLPDKAGPKDKIGFKEGVLNEDRYIVMWRRKDPEDLKKRGFDPEYPAFAPEAVKKGGWTKGREFMVSYGDFEPPRDRAKAHAAKLEKEDGERVEYGVHLQRDNTRFEENVNEIVSNPSKIDIIIDNFSGATSYEIKQIGQDVFGVSPHDFGEDADAIYSHIVDEILPMADDEEIDEYFEEYFGGYADEVWAGYQND